MTMTTTDHAVVAEAGMTTMIVREAAAEMMTTKMIVPEAAGASEMTTMMTVRAADKRMRIG